MIIKSKQVIERICVFHNSEEEACQAMQKLAEEGYSKNTRQGGTQFGRVTITELSQLDQEILLSRFPNIVIHKIKSLFSDETYHYVYYTEHERIIERREN
ncbi:hypothetical protein [Listeria booriae]|uniref:hypothetical protein n=1 Tax=Listeria booriae TaxID=1552123 RepID=UPI00162670E4|nr:hypothetical protein [Listeria booriae]MBC2196830.1 hypothetical protein [Listeria booriae]